MRAYFFGNLYLSSIQQAIQSLHVTSEMFVKYMSKVEVNVDPDQLNLLSAVRTTQQASLFDWATNHKTVICCNAGYSSEIRNLIEMFSTFDNPFPWASFNESDDALDGALTCVGIVLPARIYDREHILTYHPHTKERLWGNAALDCVDQFRCMEVYWSDMREDTASPTYELTDFEARLASRIRRYSLAK